MMANNNTRMFRQALFVSAVLIGVILIHEVLT